MPGAPDPEYVLARTALLEVLEALGNQRPAVILVGAQAIYLHTGAADLAVAEFTTDGDIASDPSALQPEPKLEEALERAGFTSHPGKVGRWQAMPIAALNPVDHRSFDIHVAGPTALLVAKLHKIGERADARGRAVDKDALDVLRLLRAVPTERFTTGVHRLLADPVSSTVSEAAIDLLRNLFSSPLARRWPPIFCRP